MEFQFKIQPFQTQAVNSVVQTFSGQPRDSKVHFSNNSVQISQQQLLSNIRTIQRENGLEESTTLASKLGMCSLDVLMETGTGKTYTYIKTIYELHRKYGWKKYLIIVPSVAIREGVLKSFSTLQQHFFVQYGFKIQPEVYNPYVMYSVQAFNNECSVKVLILNIQAFNARLSRIMYKQLDEIFSNKPIDLIAECRPIVILDEPQKMGGEATQKGIQDFNPLFSINYSATHKVIHNLVYSLDSSEAYKQKLVKKIEVKNFNFPNLGTRYLYFSSFVLSPSHAPYVRMSAEALVNNTIQRKTFTLQHGDSLYEKTHLPIYKGFTVADIDYDTQSIVFNNGVTLYLGDVTGDNNVHRLQIRETILSHLEKEEKLYQQGIKCLSLFFIDSVAKYRIYNPDGSMSLGDYGTIFEQEYTNILNTKTFSSDYMQYLNSIKVQDTHKGYFSVDRKGRMINSIERRGCGGSEDVTAYDLILKQKELLLSLSEPTRFIFSHSALREGWDNPNVFQICLLKTGNSNIARRQEIGRGLRLCVDQDGVRYDAEECGNLLYNTNLLTIITDESYASFIKSLQKECTSTGSKMLKVHNARVHKQAKAVALPMKYYAVPVHLSSEKLIENCISSIDANLQVSSNDVVTYTHTVQDNSSFTVKDTRGIAVQARNIGKYDLLGEIAGPNKLTRRTVAEILGNISPKKFSLFQKNPDEFIRNVNIIVSRQMERILRRCGQVSMI